MPVLTLLLAHISSIIIKTKQTNITHTEPAGWNETNTAHILFVSQEYVWPG